MNIRRLNASRRSLPQGLRRRRASSSRLRLPVSNARRRRGRRTIGVHAQRVPAHRARQHRHRDLQAHRIRPGPLHRHRHRRSPTRLDADWGADQASSCAPADATNYYNPAFGTVQGTGGSTAMANSWEQLRQAGAEARARLIAAAAQQLERRCPPSITIEKGVVKARGGKYGPPSASSPRLRSRSSCPGRSSRRSPMLGASSAPTSFAKRRHGAEDQRHGDVHHRRQAARHADRA